MSESVTIITIAAAALAGLAMITLAGLSGWRGWLELQRAALAGDGREPAPASPSTGARIELADLRERVRKLEAIAAGIDL